MARSSKQKVNKETQVLNNTLDEMDVIDIFRTFHPNAKEYTFSSAHGTFSRIDMTIVNIYAPNIGAPQYRRQTLTDIKGKPDVTQ